jgi:hypothetical protein
MQRAAQAKVAFADLRDALETLNGERESPKNVRRAFSRFVELTQKLTSAMRKDYSRLKAEPWKASAFSGWTLVTELFKYLRNEDQHGDHISISVHERRFYPMPTDLPLPVKVQPGQLWMFEGTWNLDDQLLDEPPDGITSYAIDPATLRPTERTIEPVRIERFYILQARSEEAENKLRAAGTPDVHALAQSAFATLSEYYGFFCAKIDA